MAWLQRNVLPVAALAGTLGGLAYVQLARQFGEPSIWVTLVAAANDDLRLSRGIKAMAACADAGFASFWPDLAELCCRKYVAAISVSILAWKIGMAAFRPTADRGGGARVPSSGA